MPTYIALLRAVNVGGTGKLAMTDFRGLLEGLGFKNVQTYIQSGNAVFDAPRSADAPRSTNAAGSGARVAAAIGAGLLKLMGAPVDVILRTHEDLTQVIEKNPFAREAAEEGNRVHVAFLAGAASPSAGAVLKAIQEKYPARGDRFHIAGNHIYFHFPEGAGQTKLVGKTVDRAIGVPGTGRNWNTVLKLHEMSRR